MAINFSTYQAPVCPNQTIDVTGLATYTPTSASDMANSANAGKIAILTNSFSLAGATLAANQILRPNGGAITGTAINLNGARIELNYLQGFSPTARFSVRYNECLSPELFGAGTASNDQDAIEAMILNSNFGSNSPNATYTISSIKTFPIETRTFRWIGNNSKIVANFAPSNPNQFLYTFRSTRLELYDIEIDGNLVSNNGILVDNADYLLNNVYMHDFRGFGPINRAIGFKQEFYSTTCLDNQIINSRFVHFEVEDDGEIGNGAGVTRGVLININEVSNASMVNYEIEGSEFSSCYAEGDGLHFFATTNELQDNNLIFKVNDCDFSDNSRRDIKTQSGGLQLTSSRFVKIASTSPWSINTTTNVSVSIRDIVLPTEYHRNSIITGNTFNLAPGDTQGIGSYLALTHTLNTLVEYNHFERPKLAPFPAIQLDKKTPGTIIRNNNFINTNLTGGSKSESDINTRALVEYNTFTINAYWTGYDVGILSFGGLSGHWKDTDFINNTIDVDFTPSNSSNFKGILAGRTTTELFDWSTVRFEGITVENNIINYTGTNKANKRFLFTEGSFGPTNIIRNHTVNGITAEGAFYVGTEPKNFVRSNNVNEQGQQLRFLGEEQPGGKPTITLSTLKAFPDAWGEGADRIVGGRGGTKFFITSLADTDTATLVPASGGNEAYYTGTFRGALRSIVPLQIIPRVSGRVMLSGYFTVSALNRSFKTFHGHLAPVGGFEIGGNTLAYSTVDDLVFRYLKLRHGNTARLGMDDAFEGVGLNRVIFDHSSFSWGADETFSLTGRPGLTFVDNILQRSIIGQSYVGHNTGSLMGYTSTEPNSNFKATIHNNLWTGVTHRTPNAAGDVDSEIRIYNNVVYDWVNRTTNIVGAPKVDVAWNYLKKGPSMTGTIRLDRLHQHQRNGYTSDPSIFVQGGYVTTLLTDPTADNRPTFTVFPNGVTTPLPETYFRTTMLPKDPDVGYTPVSALETYESLILDQRDLGANRNVDQDGNIVISHDTWDTGYLNSVMNGTISTTPEANWVHQPVPSSAPYADTNWNGIADSFEAAHGITSAGQIKTNWDFGSYEVVNDAGYDAFEIWSSYAAGDFDRLPKAGGAEPNPQPGVQGKGVDWNILLTID